jgi:pyruvate dehydrogenase E2 component (dihydrolipoamide acetyltransferase)
MATEVKLPALGESVTEGTVTQWLKSVGDEVAVDEALLEVSTDKVDTEIPSPVAGTLLEIRADEDETVEVGAVLAVIGAEGESSGTADSSADAESPDADEPSASAESSHSAEPATDAESSDGASEAESQQGGDEGALDDGSDAPSADADAAADADQEKSNADQKDDSSSGSQQKQESADASARSSHESSGPGETTDVTLPALGESVTEGTVTQWLKSVGDQVEVDEALLEVSTDKVDTEIPSPIAGTLTEIVVGEDETVEVGAVLARIGSGDAGGGEAVDEEAAGGDAGGDTDASAGGQQAEPGPESPDREAEPEAAPEPEPEPEREPQAAPKPAPEPKPEPEPEPQLARQPAEQPSASGSGPDPSYVTPLVRKLATKHNIDLSALSGTGVGGRIRKQDVLAAAEAAERAAEEQQRQPEQPAAAAASAAESPSRATSPAPAPSSLRGTTEKLSRLRKVIASRMVESLQTSAQLTTVVEVDVTAISRLRNKVKVGFEQREGVKLSFLPFFAKAAIDALKTYPQVNASIDTEAGTVTYHDGEHLGIAVDTERGLLVPVIKNAGDLSIAGIARKIQDLAARTRDNKVSPDELSGGTFTLTNTGSRGALFDTPIINQPQVGILGTGTVVKRAVVIDDPNLGETIAVRQMVYLALTYDHRLVDGADAARFLTAIKQRLEEANFESELGL